MRRSFIYKAKLSAGAVARADRQLQLCRELYNAAIEHRREAWRRARVSISRFDQIKEIKDVRAVRPEFAELDAQVLQSVIDRVGLAFDAFYRRVKAKQKPGFPRFRGRDRFDSVTYRQTGWKLDGRHLTLRFIGRIKLHLSRPVEGTIKTVTIKRDRCGDWFVSFACEDVPAMPLPATGKAVGVDLGLTAFVATSDGEMIGHECEPEPDVPAEKAAADAISSLIFTYSGS